MPLPLWPVSGRFGPFMRRRILRWGLWLALLGMLPAVAAAARPSSTTSVELRGRSGSLGHLQTIALDDGAAYVTAERVAALLKGTWKATGPRGTLTVAGHTAQFTRNESRVVVGGATIALAAPARLGPSGWLLPEDFLGKGLARLAPGVTATRAMASAPTPPAAKPTAAPASTAPPTVKPSDERRPVAVASADGGAKPDVRPASGRVALGDVRMRSYPAFTRIVIEARGAVPYTVASEAASEIRVRLRGLQLPGPHGREVDDGLVKAFALDPGDGEAVLRVTLDGTPGQLKHFVLQDPFRVVLDIYRPNAVVAPAVRTSAATAAPAAPPPAVRTSAPSAAPATQAPAPQPAVPQPVAAQPAALQPATPQLVVLDAGHGGHDPGATGPSGLTEKEVVLDVTKRVARLVEEAGLGIKVALTRSTDVFVPLRDRTNFANKHRADLFLSIHANAHPRAVSEGVETYFLSSEATDNEARQIAAIENGVVQLESPRQKGDALKGILWDLAQSEFQQESSVLAETVQDSMTRSLQLVNRGVKQAGFYVLGGAAMPAILVEIGFLTNPKEEKKLSSAEHRESVARAILAGLTDYKRRFDQRMRTVRGEPGPRRPEPARAAAAPTSAVDAGASRPDAGLSRADGGVPHPEVALPPRLDRLPPRLDAIAPRPDAGAARPDAFVR